MARSRSSRSTASHLGSHKYRCAPYARPKRKAASSPISSASRSCSRLPAAVLFFPTGKFAPPKRDTKRSTASQPATCAICATLAGKRCRSARKSPSSTFLIAVSAKIKNTTHCLKYVLLKIRRSPLPAVSGFHPCRRYCF
ncbi:hypothetical protein [Kingella potus]|uniref:hypothetical protein n=1 Tax=Kingella potus TaxID=265175 RepID=UPI001FD0B062|nr:hypothetical protein [Kingella potus]UOP00545.1 hypothetical protein LVJ84_12000 [Kingella potus]UOP02003.1 hypothetical protein LVJ84_14615 [Kingella potus]